MHLMRFVPSFGGQQKANDKKDAREPGFKGESHRKRTTSTAPLRRPVVLRVGNRHPPRDESPSFSGTQSDVQRLSRNDATPEDAGGVVSA